MSFENLDDYLNTQAENGYQEQLAQQAIENDLNTANDKLKRIRVLASNIDKDGTDLWQRLKDILEVTWE